MRICIVGATGLVGRETLTLVARAWPEAALDLYASRDQSFEHGGQTHAVKAASRLEDRATKGGELALVALDDDHSKRYVPRLLELGYRVIDKSNTYRMDPAVPLVVGGVNCQLLDDSAMLAANPNCTTIPLTMAVAPLARKWGIQRITASSYQAVSGAGARALDEFLARSKAGYDTPNRHGDAFDPAGYAGNTVPHNGKTDASGFSSEERKLAAESRKILGKAALAVSAQCCRVPIAVGHYINAWIELGEAVSVPEVEAALSDPNQAPFVRLLPGALGEGLSALHSARCRDLALVGRLRMDPTDTRGRTLCLTVVADNLRLGAATNAIRAASRWFASADPELRAPPQTAERAC